MAAAAVTIGITVLQDLISAIPAGEALWNAIVNLKVSNPDMTSTQEEALIAAMTSTIASVGADEVATLALIPPAPAKGA